MIEILMLMNMIYNEELYEEDDRGLFDYWLEAVNDICNEIQDKIIKLIE